MNNVYIVKANRTPFGKIGGSLASVVLQDPWPFDGRHCVEVLRVF